MRLAEAENVIRSIQKFKRHSMPYPEALLNPDNLTLTVERALKAISPREGTVLREHHLEQMFYVDFYLPERHTVVEINGKNHFYPYTYKKENVLNLKAKILRGNAKIGYNA